MFQLKKKKNTFTSLISQEIITGISEINISKSTTNQLDFDKLINYFGNIKCRKNNFSEQQTVV